jgi:N-acetylglutamate synthase-like GNAT family acetyltransferase
MRTIAIEPFSTRYADQIFDLILPIQSSEFGIKISREDQPDLAQIPDFYQNGDGNFWVAIAGGRVIGTIGLKDIGNRQLALRKMFVHADWRGKDKGVAQCLLQQAVGWANERAITAIFLGTTAQFLAAHRFYEKNGFAEVDKRELPVSFPIMAGDSKFYRKHLDGDYILATV